MDGVFAESNGVLRLVGDWSKVYAENADPWEQSGKSGLMSDYYFASRWNVVEALKRHHAGRQGIEIGCGHGYLTTMLNDMVGPTMGIDISGEALDRASELHPRCVFVQADIGSPHFRAPHAEFAVWGQVLWYLLDRLDLALANTLACIETGGVFLVTQAFLRGEQRYAADIANGFTGALALLLRCPRIQLVEAQYDHTDRYVHHDGLMVFRKIA